MHFHVGFAEFLIFAAYYVVLKMFILLINVEARRNSNSTLSGVAGLLA